MNSWGSFICVLTTYGQLITWLHRARDATICYKSNYAFVQPRCRELKSKRAESCNFMTYAANFGPNPNKQQQNSHKSDWDSECTKIRNFNFASKLRQNVFFKFQTQVLHFRTYIFRQKRFNNNFSTAQNLKQLPLLSATGRPKTRDLTSRDHQNCGDWHHETGQRETM